MLLYRYLYSEKTTASYVLRSFSNRVAAKQPNHVM